MYTILQFILIPKLFLLTQYTQNHLMYRKIFLTFQYEILKEVVNTKKNTHILVDEIHTE